jgi:hypothetical protein
MLVLNAIIKRTTIELKININRNELKKNEDLFSSCLYNASMEFIKPATQNELTALEISIKVS